MIPNPIMLYAAAGALIVGAAAGYKVRDWQCNAAYAKALEKAEKQRVKKQEVVDDVSKVYEAQRDEAIVKTTERINTIREIYKTIPAVPVDCSAPDAVRKLLESGIRDANAASSGEPRVEVPRTSDPAVSTARP